MIVWIIAFSRATSAPGLNCRCVPGVLAQHLLAGVHHDQFGAALGRLFEIGRGDRVVLTGARADDDDQTSDFSASVNGAETAPEFMPSIRAATEEAWHSRVQWSTLLVPKPVRTSFWNR